MLRILGRANSINVQKAMWMIGELGLDHERVDVGLQFGINDTPEYLAKNPNGLIPTLEDGDVTVWESHAVVRYLADKYGEGSSWWPADAAGRAHGGQWMDWYASRLHSPMTTIFWNVVRHPPEKRDPAAVRTATQDAAKVWSILNQALAGKNFIGGDAPSVGDIPVGCAIHRWSAMDFDKPAFAHVDAWYARLRERPPYREHVMLALS